MSTKDHNPKLAPLAYNALADTLVWPRLLGAPMMALAPRRFVIGLAGAIGLWGVAKLADAVQTGGHAMSMLDALSTGVSSIAWAILTLDLPSIGPILTRGIAEPVGEAVRTGPVAFAFVLIGMLVVWSFASVSMGRTTAAEVSGGRRPSVSRGAAFGLRGFRGAFAGIILPYAVACVFLLCAWIASFIGAWVALLPALAFVMILVVHVPASLLIPASHACERTDAVDAIQRSYAYLLTKPIRALAYTFIAAAVGGLAFTLLAFVLAASSSLASMLAGADSARPSLKLIASGFALSYLWTASTLVYLLLRRACDEQDIEDITPEGAVAGLRSHRAVEVSPGGAAP